MELQERVFLVFIDDGTIVADETKANLASGQQRYDLRHPTEG